MAIFAITGTGICLLRGHINNQSINQSTNQSKNWLFDHSIDQEIDLVVYLTSETKYPNFCTKPMQRFFVLPTIAYNAKWAVLVLFLKHVDVISWLFSGSLEARSDHIPHILNVLSCVGRYHLRKTMGMDSMGKLRPPRGTGRVLWLAQLGTGTELASCILSRTSQSWLRSGTIMFRRT